MSKEIMQKFDKMIPKEDFFNPYMIAKLKFFGSMTVILKAIKDKKIRTIKFGPRKFLISREDLLKYLSKTIVEAE